MFNCCISWDLCKLSGIHFVYEIHVSPVFCHLVFFICLLAWRNIKIYKDKWQNERERRCKTNKYILWFRDACRNIMFLICNPILFMKYILHFFTTSETGTCMYDVDLVQQTPTQRTTQSLIKQTPKEEVIPPRTVGNAGYVWNRGSVREWKTGRGNQQASGIGREKCTFLSSCDHDNTGRDFLDRHSCPFK